LTLVDRIHALLFVADSPSTSTELARALGLTEGQVEQGLELLEAKLAESGPLQLAKIAGGYQLSTRPEYADAIGAFLKPQNSKLSRTLLEVLAVVAYRQPVTMGEIDQIRGVQSDYGVRQLLERRLIQEKGRKPVPGRPVLYGTTREFLHQFNLNDLSQLPETEAAPRLPEPSLFDALEARN
jgi:segregation and condensation protein B